MAMMTDVDCATSLAPCGLVNANLLRRCFFSPRFSFQRDKISISRFGASAQALQKVLLALVCTRMTLLKISPSSFAQAKVMLAFKLVPIRDLRCQVQSKTLVSLAATAGFLLSHQFGPSKNRPNGSILAKTIPPRCAFRLFRLPAANKTPARGSGA